MIINTGMRTDIPAFYSEWFINRLNAGFVCTRNPYYPQQVTRYKLTPDVVDIFVFCTKNPAPMLPRIDALKNYGQYWFVTVTPYGADIEPNVPAVSEVIKSFKALSRAVGPHCVGWRFDPILLTPKYSVERHIRDFKRMAESLAGFTDTCVISFIDLYRKVQKNFPEAGEVSFDDIITLGREFIKTAGQYGMTVKPCAEGDALAAYGADCSGCMTLKTYEKAIGESLNAPKVKSQRPECACLLGKDIGQYDTCGHLCRYCYANADADAVRRNMRLHDPNSPFLTGGSMKGDIIHDAVQKSWRTGQMIFGL